VYGEGGCQRRDRYGERCIEGVRETGRGWLRLGQVAECVHKKNEHIPGRVVLDLLITSINLNLSASSWLFILLFIIS
jgi:hypothetical protein